jgi:hypothetical protein
MTAPPSDSQDLRRLTAVWKRRLYEDGQDDIETLGPDGPLWDQVSNAGQRLSHDSAGGGHPDEYGLLEKSHLGHPVRDYRVLITTLATLEEAREALYQPAVWRGLPARARRWWALQALAGLSHTRARLLAGVSRRHARRWRAVIVARIEGGRRREVEDE